MKCFLSIFMLRRGWKLMQETDAALGNAQHQPGVAHFDDHDPFPLRECHCVYPLIRPVRRKPGRSPKRRTIHAQTKISPNTVNKPITERSIAPAPVSTINALDGSARRGDEKRQALSAPIFQQDENLDRSLSMQHN